MKLFVITAACLSLAPCCLSQVDPAAAQVLHDSALAASKLTALSYTMNFKGELMGLTQKATAEVLMLRDPENENPWLKRWTGTHETSIAGAAPTTIQIAEVGDMTTRVDHAKKEWHKEYTRYLNKRSTENLVYLWFPELADGEPYKAYLSGPGLKLGEPVEIGGEACDVVIADMGPNQAERRWMIAKGDRLPRRQEWNFSGGITGTWAWEVSDLKVNPPLVKDHFDIPIPEGYAKFETTPTTRDAGMAAGDGTTTTVLEGGGLQTAVPTENMPRVPGTLVGNLAPEFTVPLINFDATGPGLLPVKGKTFSLAAERGGVVVLDFFGPWNSQSKAARAELQKMAASFRGQPVKIVSVAVREGDEGKATEFFAQNPYAWGLLLNTDEIQKLYKVRVIPSYFVIGFDGEIIHAPPGYNRDATIKDMQAVIERYLQTHQPATPPETPAGGGDDGAAGDGSK